MEIQLPDELFEELERLADAKEWSLAEAVQRGVELLLHAHPLGSASSAEWTLPEPIALGEPLVPVESWRDRANETFGCSSG